MINNGYTPVVSQRGAFWLVFLLISVVLVGVALGLPVWMQKQFAAITPVVSSPVFKAYDNTGTYIKPESLAAMNTYITANPQPKNVMVLKGWSSAQIAAYMVGQVSGGLKVDCSYCHSVGNFSDDSNPQKVKARQMMLMSGELNRQFISLLPASVGGYEVTCATCHNGKPVFQTYPVKIQNTLPNDFRLPLDRSFPGGLKVTGRTDISLPEVQLNQYTMYHMNASLGQGCTFCHNARYFPSYEIEQKSHALVMLRMAQYINNTYVAPDGDAAKGIMAGQTPSCWMCHQGASVPPASAKPGQVPPMLSPSSAAPAAP